MIYIFRREDNQELVHVGWTEMMEAVNGFITVDNGVQARRCAYLEEQEPQPETERRIKVEAEVVSDRLGVPKHVVASEMARAKEMGLSVEFKPDQHTPEFCNAHFPSWQARDAFAKSLGLTDMTSRNGGGSPLSPELLKRAAERILG